MKPGDLIRFTHHTSTPFQSKTQVGILISSRTSNWDKKIMLYKFLTPEGVREVVLGTKGTSWEVISETR